MSGVEEAAELRRCVRDLVACTTLPGLWRLRAPNDIAAGLVDVLVSMLRLEVAAVLGRPGRADDIEAVWPAGLAARELTEHFGDAVADEETTTIATDPSRPALSGMRVVRVPIGLGGEWGVVIAGSRREDFPTTAERLLLRVAINQGAMAMESARLMADLRQRDALKNELLLAADQARDAAERANRAKDEFLAVLSHELRTPLNAVLGWLAMLRIGSLSAADQRRALDTIERNSRNQARLIDDLLDVSCIIAGKLAVDLKPVDLVSAVTSAVDALRVAASDRSLGLRLAVDTEAALVLGDAARLEQAVRNLVGNAVKFSSPGQGVHVSVTRVGSRVRVVVTDSGIGIEPDVLPRIFDRFQQGDSSITRRYGGLGLGLAIASHIVKAHGGSITAESPGAGGGTTMTIELPLLLDAVSPALAAPSTRGVASLPRLRVLVVDDHEDSRTLIAAALTGFGVDAACAANVEEALRLAAAERFDVVVSDLAMPTADGYTLLQRLRTGHGRATPSDVPVIALTAFAGDGVRARVLAAGFADYVTKPVDPSAFVEVVSGAVTRSPRRDAGAPRAGRDDEAASR